jgi:uncharacterized protein (TIGR00730 family)
MNKTITVFGSSRPQPGEDQYKTAYELGVQLGKKGFNVCNGGFYGIMEAVSKGAVESGTEAIGVTINAWGLTRNKFLTKEIKCATLLNRVSKLIEIGDAFVILQGGTGTLLELAAVWEFSNKEFIDHKPILCHSSMWKKIVDVMNIQMDSEGRNTNLVKAFDSTEEIVNYLVKELAN